MIIFDEMAAGISAGSIDIVQCAFISLVNMEYMSKPETGKKICTAQIDFFSILIALGGPAYKCTTCLKYSQKKQSYVHY